MPPVSHLYFLGFFFGCVTVFQETEGEFTVLVSDFCSGILTTEQETGLAKCEHKLPVNTLIK